MKLVRIIPVIVLLVTSLLLSCKEEEKQKPEFSVKYKKLKMKRGASSILSLEMT